MINHLHVQSGPPLFRLSTIILWLGIAMLLISSFLPRRTCAEILEPIEQVNGTIWDVEPDRILFRDDSEDKPKLKIYYRISKEEIMIPSANGQEPVYGYLSLGGAVFVAGHVLEAGVYEWKNGVLHFLGYPNSAFSLKVSQGTKRYAIWNGGLENFFEGLFMLRDLQNGTNTVVSADNVGNWFNDVTNQGEVVYWVGAGWSGPGDTTYDYNIFRYRDGVTTRLTNDQYFWNTYPLTDGINVVYRKHDPCCGEQHYQITMYNDNLGEITLRPMGASEPQPDLDFQLRSGWIAFTKLGQGGLLQVWVRSPSGEESQISTFNASSYIDALAPNGEVTFIADGHRYLGTRGTSPIDIGPSDGKSLWLEGKWYVYIGGTLYQVGLPGTSIDKTPPAITLTATPDTLWPPNGKLVLVTIVGTITDSESGVDGSTASYEVIDEYGSVHPSGPVTVRSDGSYAFTIHLQASRNGNDKNGRQYIITVYAQDLVGNEGSAATDVTVPHDQGH